MSGPEAQKEPIAKCPGQSGLIARGIIDKSRLRSTPADNGRPCHGPLALSSNQWCALRPIRHALPLPRPARQPAAYLYRLLAGVEDGRDGWRLPSAGAPVIGGVFDHGSRAICRDVGRYDPVMGCHMVLVMSLWTSLRLTCTCSLSLSLIRSDFGKLEYLRARPLHPLPATFI
jgi:hypothetical protein